MYWKKLALERRDPSWCAWSSKTARQNSCISDVQTTLAMSDHQVQATSPVPEEISPSLRESTVAKLLVEKSSYSPHNISPTAPEHPVDLSAKTTYALPAYPNNIDHVVKMEPMDNTERVHAHADNLQRSMCQEMEILKDAAPGPDRRTSRNWKCRYCPYSAPSSRTLYSHYQFHQQLLTSHSSRSHVEWLSAYQNAKEAQTEQARFGVPPAVDGMTSLPPGRFPDRPSFMMPGYSLRHLLGGKEEGQQSASGFLRPIVQAVMKKGPELDGQRQTTSSIYQSLLQKSDENKNYQAQAQNQQQINDNDSLPNHQGPGSSKDIYFERMGLATKRVPTSPRAAPVSSVAPKLNGSTVDYGQSLVSEERDKSVSIEGSASGDVLDAAAGGRDCMSRDSTTTSDYASMSECGSVRDMRVPSISLSDDGFWMRSYSASSATSYDSVGKPASTSPAYAYQAFGGDDQTLSRMASVDTPKNCDQDLYTINRYSEESSQAVPRVSNRRMSVDSQSSTLSSISVTGSVHDDSKSQNDLNQTNIGDENHHECGVQCELLIPPNSAHVHARISTSSSFPKDHDHREEDTDFKPRFGVIRCFHCGISFEDEVLYSIHMGCHSHSDPFICNVCGKSCGNKYGFYTHIMRGHHSVSVK